MLEDEVEEKYYLSDKMVEGFIRHRQKYIEVKKATKKGYALATEGDSINIQFPKSKTRRGRVQEQRAGTLETSCNQAVVTRIGGLFDTDTHKRQAGQVWDKEGLYPTLDTMQGGYRQPSVIIEDGFVTRKYKEFIDKKGHMPELFNPYNCAEVKEIAPTQSTQCGSTTSSATVLKCDGYRIRKLTPKECYRLMGFSDEDYNKVQQAGISNTQAYKQAGNSIIVNVLEEMFKANIELLKSL